MDLKTYLETSGVRQDEFAQRVNKSQGYVSRVAAGKCTLGAQTALLWAAETGFAVRPHDLRPDVFRKASDGMPEDKAA